MNKPDLSAIQCAVCGKTVEQTEERWNPSTDEFVFTVGCHGDEESMSLSRAWLVTANRLSGGVAFATKRLMHA